MSRSDPSAGNPVYCLGGAFALLGALAAEAAATEPPEPLDLMDRVVAVIEEAPLFLSDIERAIALGTLEQQATESEAAFRTRVLDRLVDQRLRLRAAYRADRGAIAAEAIEDQIAALESRHGGAQALDRRLEELGMDRRGLAGALGDQLRVLRFIDERLRIRIFVGPEEVARHYQEQLVSPARQRGEAPPPLAEVRDGIRALLIERKLDEEIARWTSELRSRADVVILLNQTDRPLPPALPPTLLDP